MSQFTFSARSPGAVRLFASFAAWFGALACGGESLPADHAARPAAPPDTAPAPNPPTDFPPDDGLDGELDAGRPVAGKLLVSGGARIQGVTAGGQLAYFREPSGDDTRASWSADLLDLTSGISQRLAQRSSVNDRMVAKNDVVALWTNEVSPYGWATLAVWTPKTGLIDAPAPAQSLGGFLAVDDTSSRMAFSYGDFGSSGITNFAVASPSFASPPVVVAPHVGLGCPTLLQFAGPSLFVSACEGEGTSTVLRQVDAANAIAVLATGWRAFGSDAAGVHVLLVDAAGTLTLRAGTSSTTIASNVRSGSMAPDGTAMLYVTEAGRLVRRTVSTDQETVLVDDGLFEIIQTSPDFQWALVSSRAADPARRNAVDLQLVSLVDGHARTLLGTSSGAPLFFTRASSYVVWYANVPAAGSEGLELHALRLSAGEPQLLGTNALDVTEPARSHVITWLDTNEDPPTYESFDLETDGPARTVIEQVTSAVTYDDHHYVTIEDQGLYELD